MERLNIVVLSVVVAAAGLFALATWSRTPSPSDEHFATDVAPGLHGDGARVRRVPLAGDQPGRPGRERKPGEQPGDEPGKKPRRGGGSSGSALVVGGGGRAGSDSGPRLGGRPGRGGGDAEGGGDLIAANGGSGHLVGGPAPRGAGDINLPPADPAGRHTLEFVDENPPDAGGDDGALLSIPFDGSVEAKTGSDPNASGVTVDRDGVEFTEEAEVTVPAAGHVNGEQGSISFSFEPDWAGSDQTNNSLVQIRDEHVWENNLSVVKNFNTLRYIIHDENGVETNVYADIGGWQPGESHQVTATWGEGTMTLYVDGVMVGQQTVPNPLTFGSTTPIHIGSDFPGASYSGAGGRIRDFQIFGRTLEQTEITRR